jgi:predicted PurR-regulated permease PerM
MALPELDRARAGWAALGLALGSVLVYVIHSFVGTIVFGVFIYYATRPIYRRIQRRVRPRSLAAGVAIFALALPALLLVGYALLVVVVELNRLTSDETFDPSNYPFLDTDFLNRLADPASLASSDLQTYLDGETLASLARSLSSAADTLAFLGVGAVHLFVMVAIAFYLLRDDYRLVAVVEDAVADRRGVFHEFVAAVDDDFDSIFFGNILNAVLTGTIGVIAFSLLNVWAPAGGKIPAAALAGLLAGVASLIPVVGMKLVYVPIALFMTGRALLAGDTAALTFVGVFVVVAFVVVDTIPDLVLRPYVSGRSLHVGTVMLAYTLGPLLFGWYGIFLMPMLLVFVVQFVHVVLPELTDESRFQPSGVDPAAMGDHPEVSPNPDLPTTEPRSSPSPGGIVPGDPETAED